MNDCIVQPSGAVTEANEVSPFYPRGGSVVLDRRALMRLRLDRFLSQQDLADDCWRRNVRVSLPTIKRAELERPVRYRIARTLAAYYGVPVATLVKVA